MSGRARKRRGEKECQQLGLFEPAATIGDSRQQQTGREGERETRNKGNDHNSKPGDGETGRQEEKTTGKPGVLVTADRSPRFEGRRLEKPTFEQRLIMLLDMDAFFASAEQAARPELKGQPVIVGGLATDRSVVASASYEARALGIKTAMPIVQAHRICPDGVFLRGNYALYSSLSKKVMQICSTFTPLVQQASIDEAYMDLAGTERMYGTAGNRGQGTGDRERQQPGRGSSGNKDTTQTEAWTPNDGAEARNWPVGVAERLLRAIREQTGLSATIGIGPNKLVARLAMERAKPAGVCYVWPGYEAAFLATCELGEIPGIGRQTATMLADYNLRTAADVQKTGKDLLVATFGERFGQMLHEASWGRGETHLEMEYEQKSVSRDTSFERDTTDMNYIRSMLYYLAERACRTVRQMGQAAWTVSVKLRYSDFQTVGKSQTLAEPSNHDNVVYAVAKDLLEKLYTRAVSVRLVGIHLSGLVSAEQMQLQIWEQQQVRHGRLYETSDRIRERFGFCSLMKGPAIELIGKMEQDAAGLKLRTACLTK